MTIYQRSAGSRFPFGILIDVIVLGRLKAFYLIAQGNALGDCHVFLFAPCKGITALTGRKIVGSFITQGVTLGYKIKALQA
ncbi:hypothetical protein SAMN05444350_11863 [Bacteroides stercorirosoris]|uniref:Uncharacterized protein n=1 Tax=Bacteroides stercorirosoris TaxID=871324 RepID=A0A1M6HGN1_9BACE|nr:hypothetical protein SAMN05444350_11863 [Bacteroides stercorirosoris]